MHVLAGSYSVEVLALRLQVEQVGAGDGPGLGIEFLPVEEYLGLESEVGGGLFRDCRFF